MSRTMCNAQLVSNFNYPNYIFDFFLFASLRNTNIQDQSVLEWKRVKKNEELKKENEWLRMKLEEKEEEERRAKKKVRSRREQLAMEEAWRTKGLHDQILKKYMLDKKRKECLELEQG